MLHRGDRNKDLVENVERYARLGIPEYFIYDRARQQIHGYRLVGPGAKRYQRIVPQAGRYSSTLLGHRGRAPLGVRVGTEVPLNPSPSGLRAFAYAAWP